MNKYKLIIEIGMEFSDKMMEEDLTFEEAMINGDMGFSDIEFRIIDESTNEEVELESIQSEEITQAILGSLGNAGAN